MGRKTKITEGEVRKISGQKQLRGANFTRPSTAGSMPLAVCRSMHNVDEQHPVGREIENHDRIDLVYRTTRTSGSGKNNDWSLSIAVRNLRTEIESEIE